MKIGVISDNLLEQGALALGYVPTPTIETQASLVLARSIIVATKLGVFEALAPGGLTVQEIATQCSIHPGALQKLVNVLVNVGYLLRDRERYVLTPTTRKWLLKEGQHSVHDFVVSRLLAWEWLSHLEDFIRTGKPVQMHKEMSSDQWELYQRGMRSLASVSAAEVARRTPVPKDAHDMLDIGGAHGCYSVAICRRYPKLRSTILDLPEAVEHAASILAKEGMGNRVVHQVGNALKDDLGTNTYDLVFISNLIHHFDEASNRDLFRRVAQSLRPGGHFVIQASMIPPKQLGQIGIVTDLFFALTSDAGNWSFEQIANWQRQAGLVPQKPIWLMTATSTGQQAAVKP